MKHKQKITWFLSVILAAALMNSLLSPALALFSKTISVSSGVNLYLDDKKFTPKDGNGNPLEAFIHNGSTYLPVRAISEALDVPIQWDSGTQSVYIGKHTGDKPAAWIGELDYFNKDGSWEFNTITKDNLGKDHSHSIATTTTYGYKYVTYKLNGQYSYLTGLYYQLYDYRSNGKSTLSIYADDELVWEATVGAGIDPIELNLNVQGVRELEFKFVSIDAERTALGELALWT